MAETDVVSAARVAPRFILLYFSIISFRRAPAGYSLLLPFYRTTAMLALPIPPSCLILEAIVTRLDSDGSEAIEVSISFSWLVDSRSSRILRRGIGN